LKRGFHTNFRIFAMPLDNTFTFKNLGFLEQDSAKRVLVSVDVLQMSLKIKH